MNHWVDSVFDKMSYDERIGQLFMVISEPKSDNRTMQRLMRYVNEIKLGGILFHKGNPVTQAEVTNRLQKRHVSRCSFRWTENGACLCALAERRFPKT